MGAAGVGAIPPALPRANSAASSAPANAAGESQNSDLWSVLTPEERAYFDALASLGSVAYGSNGATGGNISAPVGQRVDVLA